MKSGLVGVFLAVGASLWAQDVSGKWLGELQAGPQKLRLAMEIDKSAGVFKSLDQGAEMPIKKFAVANGAVTADYGIATFEGKLDAAGREIVGTFKQGPMTFPLTYKKVDAIRGPNRPQTPARPYRYAEEEVSYPSRGGAVMAGTLTYPKTGGPFPAVLLITGSGPQDRDETIMGHKPFLVLADYLTRNGFAVLRVDDRGVAKSTGNFATATFEDKVADALSGIEFLKSHKQIDKARIGVIGHSEGGIIGPLAANKSKDVAFVVMLAGLGVTGESVLRQQGIDIVRAAGSPEEAVQKQVEVQAKVFEVVRTERDNVVAEKKIRDLLAGMPGAEYQAKMALSPGFQDFLRYDPQPVLRSLACPVLALDGTLDLQVSAKENLPAIAAALAQSKSGNWSVMQLPGLNHLFQSAKTGQIGEYATIEETIAPSVLNIVREWMERVVRTDVNGL
jgi:pimeloyl-ACP methyl ester carboxylesterase